MSNQIIDTLTIYETSDGEQWIQATRELPTCGCDILGGGTLPQPLKIKLCAKHAAAPELLGAALGAAMNIHGVLEADDLSPRMRNSLLENALKVLNAAIVKAGGTPVPAIAKAKGRSE